MDVAVAGVAVGAGCVAYVVAACAIDETWRRWSWWGLGWSSTVATATYGPGLVFLTVWESLQRPS